MATVAPIMAVCCVFHALACALEGVLFSMDDAKFLGIMYVTNTPTLYHTGERYHNHNHNHNHDFRYVVHVYPRHLHTHIPLALNAPPF